MRTSKIQRDTNETKINIKLNLDGTGKKNISTGIGFFDHMLEQIAVHGFLDLDIDCKGDLEVDTHHTVEDVGIALGLCLQEALGDKKGITRYGSFILPMDEALILCAIDFSGRSYLNFDAKFSTEKIGQLETEMIEEFFRAVSDNSKMNLHFKMLDGKNNHHIAEGLFKSFGKSIDIAKKIDPRISGVLSSKGVI